MLVLSAGDPLPAGHNAQASLAPYQPAGQPENGTRRNKAHNKHRRVQSEPRRNGVPPAHLIYQIVRGYKTQQAAQRMRSDSQSRRSGLVAQ